MGGREGEGGRRREKWEERKNKKGVDGRREGGGLRDAVWKVKERRDEGKKGGKRIGNDE